MALMTIKYPVYRLDPCFGQSAIICRLAVGREFDQFGKKSNALGCRIFCQLEIYLFDCKGTLYYQSVSHTIKLSDN